MLCTVEGLCQACGFANRELRGLQESFGVRMEVRNAWQRNCVPTGLNVEAVLGDRLQPRLYLSRNAFVNLNASDKVTLQFQEHGLAGVLLLLRGVEEAQHLCALQERASDCRRQRAGGGELLSLKHAAMIVV